MESNEPCFSLNSLLYKNHYSPKVLRLVMDSFEIKFINPCKICLSLQGMEGCIPSIHLQGERGNFSFIIFIFINIKTF
jgi:hypothetical protein